MTTYVSNCSFPQVVLQTVFLLRYAAREDNEEGITQIGLLLASLIASIYSIADKYAFFDRQSSSKAAKEITWKCKRDCISWGFILRKIWRWSELCVRFVIFSLVWVLIGGWWCLVYLILSLLFYWKMIDKLVDTNGNVMERILVTQMCIVGMFVLYCHCGSITLPCVVCNFQ